MLRSIRRRRLPLRPLALLLALFALAEPARSPAAPIPSKDKRYTLDDAPPVLAPAPGRALLLLVREQMVRKNVLPPERLYLDREPLGLLPQRSYVLADVAPGIHRIEGVVDCPPLVAEVPEGALVLLRLREVIDETDLIRARWLFDLPDAAAGLIAQNELPRATMNERGLGDLRSKWRTVDQAAPSDSLVPPADTSVVVGFDNVWFEHPLDPLNFRREFTAYTGRLEMGPHGLAYYMEKKRRDVRVEIAWRDIVNLRFGGIRSAGVNPWIDLFYRSNGDVLGASFADSGPEGEAVYNRMFSLARARWLAARPDSARAAAADSAR